jgi:hypothetical protein
VLIGNIYYGPGYMVPLVSGCWDMQEECDIDPWAELAAFVDCSHRMSLCACIVLTSDRQLALRLTRPS